MNKIVLIVAAGALGAVTAWLVFTNDDNGGAAVSDNGATECTMDAMLCPDGSSVGREGPDCEFAACPAEAVPDDVQAEIDAMRDEIIVNDPPAGSYIASPLQISGEARGAWLNEGDFPIVLTDWNGEIIAEHFVSAEDDWMTESFVPFSGELTFESPYEDGFEESARGWLIFQKDNPSGLPEHDAAVEIPVWFAE